MINYCELKKKCVVNVSDGKKLGKVKDIVFSFPEGKILSLIVGDPLPFSGKDDYEIDLCCVKKIGDDAILVTLFEPTAKNDEITDGQ